VIFGITPATTRIRHTNHFSIQLHVCTLKYPVSESIWYKVLIEIETIFPLLTTDLTHCSQMSFLYFPLKNELYIPK
jgi:hypothetical protein